MTQRRSTQLKGTAWKEESESEGLQPLLHSSMSSAMCGSISLTAPLSRKACCLGSRAPASRKRHLSHTPPSHLASSSEQVACVMPKPNSEASTAERPGAHPERRSFEMRGRIPSHTSSSFRT